MSRIYYRAADINGLKISYRDAGRPDDPTLLLLHGFPTAGHMFRDLIPLVATENLNPNVMVMQPTQDRPRRDTSVELNGSECRRILV
jgi:predicted esterase